MLVEFVCRKPELEPARRITNNMRSIVSAVVLTII